MRAAWESGMNGPANTDDEETEAIATCMHLYRCQTFRMKKWLEL